MRGSHGAGGGATFRRASTDTGCALRSRRRCAPPPLACPDARPCRRGRRAAPPSSDLRPRSVARLLAGSLDGQGAAEEEAGPGATQRRSRPRLPSQDPFRAGCRSKTARTKRRASAHGKRASSRLPPGLQAFCRSAFDPSAGRIYPDAISYKRSRSADRRKKARGVNPRASVLMEHARRLRARRPAQNGEQKARDGPERNRKLQGKRGRVGEPEPRSRKTGRGERFSGCLSVGLERKREGSL